MILFYKLNFWEKFLEPYLLPRTDQLYFWVATNLNSEKYISVFLCHVSQCCSMWTTQENHVSFQLTEEVDPLKHKIPGLISLWKISAIIACNSRSFFFKNIDACNTFWAIIRREERKEEQEKQKVKKGRRDRIIKFRVGRELLFLFIIYEEIEVQGASVV